MFRHRACGPLLDLDDVRARLGLRAQVARGVRPIAVTSIVGTAGRCCDFDRCFHPLKPKLEESAQEVKRWFPTGQFPPIDVVQVGEAYFVVDGHHRVAAARDLGIAALDAYIVELASDYRLGPDASLEMSRLPPLSTAFASTAAWSSPGRPRASRPPAR